MDTLACQVRGDDVDRHVGADCPPLISDYRGITLIDPLASDLHLQALTTRLVNADAIRPILPAGLS